jgi:hypothetical protein
VDDTPFLLWEIGMKTVLEHWADTLYARNDRMVLWVEEIDSRVLNFVNDTYPLCRNVTIRIGVPEGEIACCTFLNADGSISFRQGSTFSPYLPEQAAPTTWFNLVRKWLETLTSSGSATPEIEQEIQPGVFIGHHCRISRHARFEAPCWIGSRSTVGEAAIGPYAVIGEDSVISRRTSVTESYVLRDTFVGEHLTIEGVAAGNSILLDHRTGVIAPVDDSSILHAIAL